MLSSFAKMALQIGRILLLAWGGVMLGIWLLQSQVLPQIDRWNPSITRVLSEQLGMPIAIDRIEAQWRGLHPQLTFYGLKIEHNDQVVLQTDAQLLFAWRSLLLLQPRFQWVVLQSTQLVLQVKDGSLAFAGRPLFADSPGGLQEQWPLPAQLQVSDGQLRVEGDTAWSARALDLNLKAGLSGLELALQLSTDAGQGGELRLVGQINPVSRWVPGSATQQRWYARVSDLELENVFAWLPSQWRLLAPLMRGNGAAQLWFDRAADQGWQIEADLDLANVMLSGVQASGGQNAIHRSEAQGTPGIPQTLALQQLQGRVRFEPGLSGQANVLLLQQPRLVLSDSRRLEPESLEFRWSSAGGRLTVGMIDMQALQALIEPLDLPGPWLDALQRWQPRGLIPGLDVSWQGPWSAPREPVAYLSFDALGVGSEQTLVSADGLSGTLQLDSVGVTLILDTPRLELIAPQAFGEQTLRFDDVDLRAIFYLDQGTLRSVELLQASTAQTGLRTELSGRWLSEPDLPLGRIEVQGMVEHLDLTRLHRFFPLQVPTHVRQWLQRAFRSGTASDVSVLLSGPLHRFPFREGDGRFEVAGSVESVQLDFAPRADAQRGPWPYFDGIRGQVRFAGPELSIEVDSARVRSGNNSLGELQAVQGRFADFLRDPELQIEGRVLTTGLGVQRYFAQSPLLRVLPDPLLALSAQGDLTGTLELAIPVLRPAQTRVQGRVLFDATSLALGEGLPTLEALYGELLFDAQGFALGPGFRGVWRGIPLRAEGGLSDRQLDLSITGTVGAVALEQLSPYLVGKVRGQTDASLRLQQGGGPLQVELQSDLQGLEIDWVKPIGKDASRTSFLNARWQSGEQRRFDLDWTDVLTLRLEGTPERWVRGAIGMGVEPAMPRSGLFVAARLPQVDVEAWSRLLAAGSAPDREAPEQTLPELQGLSLQTDQLQVGRRDFGAMQITLRREASRWQFDLQSPRAEASGEWSPPAVQPPRGLLTAHFTRLSVPRESADSVGSELAQRDPQTLPALDLRVDELELGELRLGQLILQARNERPDRWDLSELVIDNPAARLTGEGIWWPAPLVSGVHSGESRTELEFDWQIRSAAELLERLGVAGALRGGNGVVSGQLSWVGLPHAPVIDSLDGELSLSLDQGQFLPVEPGLGRLLGVLSLQALPRRITLDFRDVFSQGFSFDAIRGQVSVREGLAQTDNFRMSGPSATVALTGRVDLNEETQDLRALVIPVLDASAASVLYGLAVNPAIGFGTLIAQWLLRRPLAEALSFEYQIRGNWSEPSVERVSRTVAQ